jgi:Tfp pilus assembly protein PilF
VNTGRNELCPCGSGKKYKKCCQGKFESHLPLKPGQQKTNPVASDRPVKGISPVPVEFSRLIALFKAGHHAELERQVCLLLERYPDSGFAWKVLSISLLRQGKDALLALQNATRFLPDDAETHYNLANHLKGLARLDEAEAGYRQALQIKPDYVAAHNNLGNLVLERGRLDEAEASYRRVLQIRPDFAEIHYNLGNILRDLGRQAEAGNCLRWAIQLKPDFAEAHNNLGNILRDLGRQAEAENCLRWAIQLKPDFAEAHNNLGSILMNQGWFVEADISLRWALKIKPDYAEAQNNLGSSLMYQNRLIEAETCLRQALMIDPDFAEAYGNLGCNFLKQGRFDEAEVCLRRALEIKPDFAEAYGNQSSILMEQGMFTEAEVCLRRALEIKPDFAEARFSLAQIRKVKASDENLMALIAAEEAVLSGTMELPEKELLFLHFALGKSYDDIGDHEKAFPHFIEGCRLKRAMLDYDPDKTAQDFAGIMRNFDAVAIDRLHGDGDPSHMPIFVLGMPRSGTTLVEQIIASHPEVHGAGELHDLMAIARRDIGATAFPDNLRLLDRERLAAWGAEYVSGLQQRAPDARRITDKAPVNFLSIGLIHLMLPNAKIIHVNRNPVDTCLSCFSKLFTFGQEHTYDLFELGRYYADYARLMAHWRKVLPAGAFLDVQYEDIVADQETQARRLIEYCGLEWNDACLDFHKNKRAVRTASVAQVRQPIYKSSVERWRPYEKFLGPLFDALGDLIPERC